MKTYRDLIAGFIIALCPCLLADEAATSREASTRETPTGLEAADNDVNGSGTSADSGWPASLKFDEAYDILTMADDARDSGLLPEAVKLYREALNRYITFSQTYPQWQPSVVKFRISYCDDQLEVALDRLQRRAAGAEDQSREIAYHAEPQGSGAAQDENKPADPSIASVKGRTEERDANKQLESPIDSIKRDAKRLLKTGEAETARELLLEGLRLDPDDGAIRLLMGVARCQTGEFEDAIYLLQQMIEEAPSNANIRVALAGAYFGLGHLTAAEEELEHALAINPDLPDAHLNMIQILLSTTPLDLDGARDHYIKALNLGVEPEKSLDFLLK